MSNDINGNYSDTGIRTVTKKNVQIIPTAIINSLRERDKF